MYKCTVNLELSLFTKILMNNLLSNNENTMKDYLISTVISEAIFLALFYDVIQRVYEGETLIDPYKVFITASPQFYIDKQIFKERHIIDDVDSYEAYEFFNELNYAIRGNIPNVVPIAFVNELIKNVLENKPIIDYMHQSNYYIIQSLSRCIISSNNFTRVDAVYTHWIQYKNATEM